MSDPQQEFEKHYDKLNEAQREAVDAIEGPVLVIAGPGSGKTEILSMRAANILRQSDIYASGILCLTFTESAEVNMRERLAKIMGSEGYRVGVHTFHNFCKRLKNEYSEYFDDTAFFDVADNIIKIEILEDIFADLPHDWDIRSEHPEFGFNYLKPARNAISDLKQAGLSPDEFEKILDQNDVFIEEVKKHVNQVFSKRTTDDDMLESLAELAEMFADYEAERIVPTFRPLSEVLAKRLTYVIEEAKETDSTKPITALKKEVTKKIDGKRVLKAGTRTRARELVHVYREYEEEKYRRGYHDFDDLILDVIQEIESNDTFRAEVSESFQYIEVDEFQDTNDAQLRLLMAVAGEHPENNPNIMVVGDDDQSIYRFQGAEVGNITNFKDYFANPQVITLTENYRSKQHILDKARTVITQGENRLENHLEEIEKDLSQAMEFEDDSSQAVLHELPTRTHHNRAVAKIAKELIDEGIPAEEIAVIGRLHDDLEQVVPYFHELEIPIAYKRQQNVLEEPHIRELVTMCRFLNYLNKQAFDAADSLLPEILSYDFWGLERDTVWELSLTAYEKRQPWLSVMKEHKSDAIKQIANFFLDLSKKTTHQPAEHILDKLIGADITEDIGEDETDADEIAGLPETDVGDFSSPFKSYYFYPEKLEEDPAEYLRFLSSLKEFVRALRNYKEGQVLSISELVDFVDTHEKNNELVTDTSPFINSKDAVTLTTAHGAKGLEFDAVILAAAVQDRWADKSQHRRIYFPGNLPVAYEGDEEDDYIRLLYVAMTRARHQLHAVSFISDDDGAEQVALSFLEEANLDTRTHDDLPDTTTILESTTPDIASGPYVGDEKDLLLPLLEQYETRGLSVTHLNNFLDVRYGGPKNFLTSNLLRFPQPMSKHLVYGSAIHETIEKIYHFLRKEETHPSTETVLEWFRDDIENRRIDQQTKEYLKERGADSLKIFYKVKKDDFSTSHFSEYSFSQEGVVVNGVPITGKIDKLVPISGEKMSVHDFKTGSSFDKWVDYQAKPLQYGRQLIFYKLLVENSSRFKDIEVDTGVIEFVEPDDGEVKTLEKEITQKESDDLKELIAVVYEHIMNLNFPDTSDYSEDAKGIKAFEQDLLEGNI